MSTLETVLLSLLVIDALARHFLGLDDSAGQGRGCWRGIW